MVTLAHAVTLGAPDRSPLAARQLQCTQAGPRNMGACGSRSKAEVEAAARDAELTKQNYDDYMKQQQKIKLLLLGKARTSAGFCER